MAGFNFTPSYQDYLNTYNSQHGNASEGGGGGALSEQQWNSLGSQGQWNQLGNSFAIGPDDPRYAGLAQQLGIKPGTQGSDATIVMGSGKAPLDASRQNGHTSFVNPGAVLQGDGMWATAHNNLTPEAEFSGGGMSDKQWALAAASVLGGGAALGTYLGGGGAVTGAGMEGGGFSGYGDVAGSGASGGASGGSALGNSIVGNDPAYPGTGNPNYTGPGEFGAGPSITEPPADPAYPGTGNPNYAGPDPSMEPAPVVDHSVTQPWYQPYVDKFTGPGALGRFLGALPGVASALKPLGSGPPGGGATMAQANGLMGNKVQGLNPTAHPFQSAQNDALNFKPSTPVRSLGDYLKGT
jgi:hypothetical protein